MTKAIVSISVDPQVWDVVKVKYPNKTSKMIQEFLSNLIANKSDNIKLKDLELEISELQKQYDSIGEVLQYKKGVLAVKRETYYCDVAKRERDNQKQINEALAKTDAIINSGFMEQL